MRYEELPPAEREKRWRGGIVPLEGDSVVRLG